MIQTKKELHFQDFTAGDYKHLVELHNANYSGSPLTIEDFQEGDKGRNKPHCKHHRWIIWLGEKVVGYGEYSQYPWEYEPDKFQIHINVLPDYQKQGIGAGVYYHILQAVRPFQPRILRTETRSDMPRSMHFLEALGFEEYYRLHESLLDLNVFVFEHYQPLLENLKEAGITFTTLREMAAQDPNCYRELYEMDWEVTRDEPGSEDDTKRPFEEVEHWFKHNPNVLHDAYIIALDGNNYVGCSFLVKQQANDTLQTGMTGVRRAYRRKGIATAMKIHALKYAVRQGYSKIKTWNEARNIPMLAINQQLGFVPVFDQIRYEKVLNTNE